ncbi:BON domain-containing protein [Methylobrevis pamukkalensis]|uniref:Periplasmic protein n=1 Tax=Methylobrevis pamukkalensis TaxID=1439726 RepID=A0A1E3H1C3_9HYPH|nr:BON domain-containing protein [Methylobrevis pamukkalensis]ODN70107.1 periplasmic protein [Methylobrevis pamukkalensis]
MANRRNHWQEPRSGQEPRLDDRDRGRDDPRVGRSWDRQHEDDRDMREYGGSWEHRAGYHAERPADYPDMRFADPDRRRPHDEPYHAPIGPSPVFAAQGYFPGDDAGRAPRPGRGRPGAPGGERGVFDRASDEVSSWFGDEEAERRRRSDEHRGKGPRGYVRSDARIEEEVNERLAADPSLDASDIEVTISSGEVTLAGEVSDRWEKRRAEDCIESVLGVGHIQNNLRIRTQSRPM